MGDEIMVDGKRIFQGLIRQAKDAQMMYNAMQSAKVLYLFMASRAPYQGPAAAIEGYEDIWKSANTRNYSYLPTNEKDADGNPIPQPQRTMPPQVGTGWIEASQAAKEDLKSVIGMYQASLGMAGQEVSGRAITAREKQSDNATFHFADNLARAIALTGRIILGMIPTIYDTKRLITIVGTDDARSDVMVNNPQPDPNDPFRAIIENDLTTGQYSVTVESGPNYATKRAEAADSMLQLVQSYPPVMQLGWRHRGRATWTSPTRTSLPNGSRPASRRRYSR